jgi:peptide subunit release factor RF-3
VIMMDYSLLLNQNEKKSSTHKKAAFELGLQYVVLPLVRTLAAADNAVMLVDAGKGLEPQTRKLFEVCRMRRLPIFTFINKMDRPALEPLELLDQIEREFGLSTYPVNWPIGSGDRFVGVYYRPRQEVHLFEKGKKHGSQEASVRVLPWGDPSLEDIIDRDLFQQLQVCLAMNLYRFTMLLCPVDDISKYQVA